MARQYIRQVDKPKIRMAYTETLWAMIPGETKVFNKTHYVGLRRAVLRCNEKGASYVLNKPYGGNEVIIKRIE